MLLFVPELLFWSFYPNSVVFQLNSIILLLLSKVIFSIFRKTSKWPLYVPLMILMGKNSIITKIIITLVQGCSGKHTKLAILDISGTCYPGQVLPILKTWDIQIYPKSKADLGAPDQVPIYEDSQSIPSNLIYL